MISTFQHRWGVEQWVAYLKDKDIPILSRSRELILEIAEKKDDRLSPKILAETVLDDPFLAVKLIRRVEGRRSQTLGQETTTALAAVLQAGIDGMVTIASQSKVCSDDLAGLTACEQRVVNASLIARRWAILRADMAADEVALAALLSETGELLLWHFAPELPQKAWDELQSGRALRTIQAQQQAVGFQFKQLTLALTQAWELPGLINLLIRGSDHPRANITRLAMDTARHISAHPENPAIPADIVNIKALLPGLSLRSLIFALPISLEYKEEVLLAVTENQVSGELP